MTTQLDMLYYFVFVRQIIQRLTTKRESHKQTFTQAKHEKNTNSPDTCLYIFQRCPNFTAAYHNTRRRPEAPDLSDKRERHTGGVQTY